MQLGESVGAAEPGFEEVVTASLPVSEEEKVVEQGVQGQVYPQPEETYEQGYEDQPGQGQQE